MKTVIVLFLSLLPVIKSTSVPGKNIKQFDQETRNRIAKSIINDLSKEDYDGVMSYYDISLKQNLPREKLQEVWQNIVNNYGPYSEVISMNNIVNQGYNQVILRLKFEKGNLTLELTYNQDDQVFGLFFKV